MHGSTSHCTNRHKLDFVLTPAKQFSLSALANHCKNLTAVLYCLPDSNSNLNMGSPFDWLINDNGPLRICPLGLLERSSFCSDRGGPREKIVLQERVQSSTCDSWCSGWSSHASFRVRMVGKCGSFVRLFLCRLGDGTILAVVHLSGP